MLCDGGLVSLNHLIDSPQVCVPSWMVSSVSAELVKQQHQVFLQGAAVWQPGGHDVDPLTAENHSSIVRDGLDFWASDVGGYCPMLKTVALPLLSAPATSASSERFFSNAAVVDHAMLDSGRLEKMAVVRAFATSQVFLNNSNALLKRAAAWLHDN